MAGYARGTSAQRKGVATAAAYNCDDAETCVRCVELLEPLLDDPDQGIREKAGEFLREPEVLRSPTGRRLAVVYAGGQEFTRHPFWLVEAIRKHQDSLVPLAPVFDAVCGRLAADLADPARRGDHRAWVDLERFFPLTLRLYEQAEQGRDVQLRNRCLDWWDRLLEARLGGAAQALGELDAGAA
ncbi:MAG: hypothetical protein U0840_20835 [Gemmataceae bacterium]